MVSTPLILLARRRVEPPPNHLPDWDPGPGSKRPLGAWVEGRFGDEKSGPARAGPGRGGPKGKGRGDAGAGGGGEGGIWGGGSGCGCRCGAAGRPEGGGSLSSAGRGVKAPGSLARSHCGTGCGRPRRWRGAGEGRGEDGAPLWRTRRDWRLAAPHPAAPEGFPGAPARNRNYGHVQTPGQTAAGGGRPTDVSSEKSGCRSWGNRAPTSPGLRPTGHRRF